MKGFCCSQLQDLSSTVSQLSPKRRGSFFNVGAPGSKSQPPASGGVACRGIKRLECRRLWGRESARCHVAASPKEFDVVIVGAGIIGLAIANSVLTETSLSVALVDAARPCAGATGAGDCTTHSGNGRLSYFPVECVGRLSLFLLAWAH